MNYNFKFLSIPENNEFSEDHLKFLKKLDESLHQHKVENTDKIQDQLDYLMKHLHAQNTPSYNTGGKSKAERDLVQKWIVRTIKGKDTSDINQELKNYQSKDFTDYLDTGAGSGNDAGDLVPELLQAEIAHFVEEYGFARRKMRYLPFGDRAGNTRKLPTEDSGVSVDWVDEAGLKPLKTLSIGFVKQELKELAGIVVISEQLMEDSAVDLVSYVSRRLGSAIAKEEDRVFFGGDTGDADPFDGILNATGTQTVAMDTTDRLTDITPDHLLDMIYAVGKYARTGAEFYLSSDAMLYLRKFRTDAVTGGDKAGEYLLTQPTERGPARLFGYAVNILDTLPDETEAGQAGQNDVPFAFFGNLQKCAAYADKQGMRIKILQEATLEDAQGDKISLAQSDMMGIRVFKRVSYCLPLASGISILKTGPSS
jgi:HK97 family phage major capsid protein